VATPTRRGRPTQAEAKRLHQKLRKAAVATFVENGYDGTTMEAIARAAGITRRTLYARYPDKRAVFVLYDLDGHTAQEISAALELPLFTVYSRLRVARERFAAVVRRADRSGGHDPLRDFHAFMRLCMGPQFDAQCGCTIPHRGDIAIENIDVQKKRGRGDFGPTHQGPASRTA